MCRTRLAKNTGCKNSASAHHRTTLSDYIFATIVKQQHLLHKESPPRHNMVNFAPLTAEISWPVWGTPANFDVFRVLASLLHQRRSTEVNQTLHGVWRSPGLVHYIYIFGGSCLLTEFCRMQNSHCVQVLTSILAALLHGIRSAGVIQTLRRGTRKFGRYHHVVLPYCHRIFGRLFVKRFALCYQTEVLPS